MKKYIYLVLTFLWMVVIFRFSSQTAADSTTESMAITEKILRFFIANPSNELIDSFENIVRKLAHFSEYFVLGDLFYITLRSFGLSKRKSAYAILFSAIYAVSDEIHQYFIPGRACRWYDMVIDTSGSVFGYFSCIILASLKNRFLFKNRE